MFDAPNQKYGFVPFNHEKPNFFPVATADVYDDKGKKVPGYLRVQREDTGDTLAIHTDSYTMVPYERHFSLFEEAIERSSLANLRMEVATDMDRNGARIFRQYMWPDLQHEVAARNATRKLSLRIFMWDSYDGTSAFIGRSGFFDWVCANSAYIGKTLADVKFRHVGDMEAKVRVAADQLTAAADEFSENVRRMNHWTQVRLMAEQVEALVLAMPQSNKAVANEIVTAWAKQDDPSLWGVHQALTSWGTHGIPVRTQADRGKRISTLVEGRDWKVLEAA
jgi:protein associated with RNAse G/E